MAEYGTYLAPVSTERLTIRVAALRAHWYVPELPRAAGMIVADDWLEALGDYPEWAVAEACREWIAEVEDRPTPAGIARRCGRLVGAARITAATLSRLLAARQA